MNNIFERKKNIEKDIKEIKEMLLNHPDHKFLEIIHEDELNRLNDELEQINLQIKNGE